MKTRAKVMAILVVAVSLFYWSTASSQPERGVDRTLSPYFFVQSDDSSVDQLPLKSTAADVRIAGVIADVRVTQVYKNEGRKPLESSIHQQALYLWSSSMQQFGYPNQWRQAH